MQNCYKILEIPEDAGPDTIEAAYSRLLKADSFGEDYRQSRRVEMAFVTLMDPDRRRKHDEALGLTRRISETFSADALKASALGLIKKVLPFPGAHEPVPGEPPPAGPTPTERTHRAVESYRAAVEAALADGFISPAEEKFLGVKARELGLSEAEVAAVRREAFTRPEIDKKRRLKQKSCPRCDHRFNVFEGICPDCGAAQTLCPNRECGALHHFQDAQTCVYCGAQLSREPAAMFQVGPDRRGELRGRRVDAVEYAWTRPLQPAIRATPVCGLGYVYAATTGGQIHAFDQTGEPMRTSDFPRVVAGGGVFGTPVYDKGTLFVATSGGYLYAIDAWTGRDRQEMDVGQGILASPLCHDGVLYVATLEGTVLAYRAGTLELLWAYSLDLATAPGKIIASPVLFGDLLIVATDTGDVVALATGDTKVHLAWQARVEGPILATPLALSQVVCVYSASGRLTSFKRDGSVVCSEDAISGMVEGSPASWRGGNLFVCSADERLYLQNPTTGALDPSYPVRNTSCPVVDALQGSPLVIEDMVFYGGEAGYLYGVSAPEARIVWNYRLGAPTRCAPAFDGHFIYIGDDNGYLHTFKTRNGAP